MAAWARAPSTNPTVRLIATPSHHDTDANSAAGYAYCAIAALSLLERPLAESSEHPPPVLEKGIPSLPSLLRFLVGRQLAYVDPPDSEDDEDEDEVEGSEELGADSEHVGFNGRWNKRVDTCYCWWVGGTLKVCPPSPLPPLQHPPSPSPLTR